MYCMASPDPDDEDERTPTGERAGSGSDEQRQTAETDPRSVLIECLDEPSRAKQRLPYVLSLLDSEDRSTRLLAATTCCLVVTDEDDEELLEYLVDRLGDRLGDEDVSLELTQAMDYLCSAYEQETENIFSKMADEDGRRPITRPAVGEFTRNFYYKDQPDIESMEQAGTAGADDDPRLTYSDDDQTEREPLRRHHEDDEADDSQETGGGPANEQSDATLTRRPELSTIAARSRFDELHIKGADYRGRYADTYEVLVGEGSEEQAVTLRLLHQPAEQDISLAFGEEVREYLLDWEAVSSHENIASLLDWSIDPRPWMATPYTGTTAADRGRYEIGPMLDMATSLADAVSCAHRHGIVHGAIDPKNVVYAGSTFEDATDYEPLLDNVGLIHVFRRYVAPERCLDPRFAAPEYYSNRFGQIDHATDIYQLGSTLYRLFTGRSPFTGKFRQRRTAILQRQPLPPSSIVDDLPPEIDDLLSKAMAKQKLRRYETIEHLQQELASIADEYEHA